MKKRLTLNKYYDSLSNGNKFAIFMLLIFFPCLFIGVGSAIYELWPPPDVFIRVYPWFNKTTANWLMGIGIVWLACMTVFRLCKRI